VFKLVLESMQSMIGALEHSTYDKVSKRIPRGQTNPCCLPC